MKITSPQASNGPALRLFNPNVGEGKGGTLIEIEIEYGEQGTITLPAGWKIIDDHHTDDLGCSVYGFAPPATCAALTPKDAPD